MFESEYQTNSSHEIDSAGKIVSIMDKIAQIYDTIMCKVHFFFL